MHICVRKWRLELTHVFGGSCVGMCVRVRRKALRSDYEQRGHKSLTLAYWQVALEHTCVPRWQLALKFPLTNNGMAVMHP